MMVRKCAGTPLRSSKAGSSVAPKPRVMPRLTSATAASMAGIAPSTPSRPSHAGAMPCARRMSSGIASKDRGDRCAGADVTANAGCPAQASRPGGQRRAVADRGLEGASAAAEQVIAGIGAANLLHVGIGRRSRLRRLYGTAGNVQLRAVRRRARAPRWHCDRDCASGNPCRGMRCRQRVRRPPG